MDRYRPKYTDMEIARRYLDSRFPYARKTKTDIRAFVRIGHIMSEPDARGAYRKWKETGVLPEFMQAWVTQGREDALHRIYE